MIDYFEEHRGQLMKMLAEMRQQHEAEMRPIIDQLVRIECLRPPAPLLMVLEQAEEMRKAAWAQVGTGRRIEELKREIDELLKEDRKAEPGPVPPHKPILNICDGDGGCVRCQPAMDNPLGQCQRYNQNAYPGKA